MLILRYLTRDILTHTAAVSMVILLVVFSSQFVRQLGNVAEGDLAAEFLASLMLFSLPSYIELVLPLGFFVGLMLALGRLYIDSEITVLNTGGLGPVQLLRYTLVSGLLVASLSAIMSLAVTPWSKERVLGIVSVAADETGLAAFAPGRFQRRHGGFDTIYAESVDANSGILEGIFLAAQEREADGPERITLTYAERGRVVFDEENRGRYLELSNGRRYHGVPGLNEFRITQFKTLGERLPETEGQGSGLGDDFQDAKATLTLLKSEDASSQATLAWRASLVFMPLNLSLLALGLARTDKRRGRYVMLLPAILLYLVYLVTLANLRASVAEGGSAFVILVLHLIIAGVGGIILMWPSLRLRVPRRVTT